MTPTAANHSLRPGGHTSRHDNRNPRQDHTARHFFRHTANAVNIAQMFCTWVSFRLRLASKRREEEQMRKDDLMKSDLLSEILLLGGGIATVLALVVIVAATLTHAATVQ
jgi:hypothetical protein